jgi:alpha-mannosidase
LEKKDIKNHHKGELYLETHQGTLTTQGKNKYYNRLCERLLHNAEFMATYGLCSSDKEYPYAFLQSLWHEVLLYQFHDILPGSSITRVNREACEGYGKIVDKLNAYMDHALEDHGVLSALNPTSFYRKETILHDGKLYRAALAPYSSAPLAVIDNPKAPTTTSNTMDNGIIKLTFNERGEICSCVTGDGHEMCKGVLNRLTVFKDKFVFPFNAWDIDIKYRKRKKIHLKADKVRVFSEGDTAIRESVYRYKKCTIIQRVILSAGSDSVLFKTEVDWHTRHRMLRAEFFPAEYGETARFDIQFGHIERPTTERDSVESAQFEVCAHKWVATQNDKGGFALLNDCKYGHHAKNGVISLNLLRSPIFPDKVADRGSHSFSYMFCPFENGNLNKVVKEGYRLNNPLVIYNGKPIDSLVSVSNEDVIIETIKASEDSGGIIVRLYEALGKNCTTALNVNLVHTEAVFTDMTENELGLADLSHLSFTPFEVKTIKLIRTAMAKESK